MGAGSYVGRIGSLAVALGVGAAIVAGAGVAAAEDSEGSSSSASSESSSSSESGSSTSGPSGSSTSGTSGAGDAGEREPSDDTVNSDDGAGLDGEDSVDDNAVDAADEDAVDEDAVDPEDEVDEDAADEDAVGDDTVDDVDEDAAEEDASVDETPDEAGGDDEATGGNESADEAAGGADGRSDRPELSDAEPAGGDAVEEPASVEVEEPAAAETPTDEGEQPATEQPAAGQPAEPSPVSEPADPEVPGAEAEVVTADVSALDPEQQALDEGPALPALASLVMSIVGAGREATNETPESVGDLVTTSLVEADAAAQYPIPTDVVVEQWTPPLQWLQNIPVLGPLVVTPLVGLAHVIPFVGDILNPVIGFPIDHWAPEGTPQARSFRVTSFDGTRIFVHFMPAKGLQAGETAPTVLNGPGLGLPGATTLELDVDSFLPRDTIGVGALREAGYNVVTWDPRGEWRSEGIMTLDSPDYEGRDMSHIISYLATLPEVALDAANDPRIGMTGASYGGGIQLATAAIDHRIDAIVPTIAWNSLVDVLFPRGAVNSGWGTLLPTVLALTFAREHPRIFPVAIQGVLFGIAEDSDIELVNDLGFQDQIGDITAPTLLIQGTVDTLFTLDQAHTNALALIEAGTTTKVVWYCGGHGACLSDYNDGEVVIDRTLRWLDRYVKGDESVDTGPQFEWVDQNGEWYSAEEYPVTEGTPVVAERTDRRTIPFVPLLGGSGPNPLILTRGLIATLLGLPSAAGAINAVSLRVPDVTELTHIVGAPEITLTYSGDGNAEHVYAQIVDDRTGLVLGNHATPIPVVLDGDTHTVTFSMGQVAHTLAPGQSVTVQIVTSSAKFLNFYSWGAITVEGMSVSLPTRAAEESATVAA
ncbi:MULTISPECIES: CocE/NonD family hydrolase [Mycobacteriaceae]|uniref:Peptidase S15 n=1 Tax=Mycolicibacterium parafortuitum TaxID=39692 RepID=A0ACC6ME78_MYCPF|nr:MULTISPECIES: CocE/NonD family hydrolase [Mycobacteriaceae]MDZ5085271.1 peptidase S15 [Mycolicibacterium parafortuitum]